MGSTPAAAGRPPGSLREAVIVELSRRIRGGFYPESLERDLERAIASQTIQLAHNNIPAAWRPHERTWNLYELRGEQLVGVPTWRPGQPHPPREWTVPVASDHPQLRNDPRASLS
ncbi:hypothetical protein [Mycobacterium sp.]|uniref:hypothetical protein n=1 Tax=Mycobacterium sp. TaxID=1785 RepID=UPI003C70A3A6